MASGRNVNGNTPLSQLATSSKRISLDTAESDAETYLKAQNDTALQVSRVIEFEDAYYVIVTESSGGRGALELLVDPFSGKVSAEAGRSQTLNQKYGSAKKSATTATDNTVTLAQARTKAAAELTAEGVGATVNEGGYNFYGYYTFEYSIDGKTAGLISVNGTNGTVWFHARHGQFIGEKEF